MALFVPKDRRSLFRQFLSGMYDSVVITDPNGYIIEVNPRTIEYFGYEAEEFIDKPVSMIIPGLKQEVVQRIRKGLDGNRHVVIDANGVAKEGNKIACEVAVSSIDLMNPGDLIFTIRNVERRRAYMNAFRAKANAFEIAQVALFACDQDGRFMELNGAFRELFDIAVDEEPSSHLFNEFMGESILLDNFKKALQGERTLTGIVADGDDGDQEELEIVLAPNVHGHKIVGVVGSIQKL